MKKEIRTNIESLEADSFVLYRLPNGHDKHVMIGECEVLKNGLLDSFIKRDGFVCEPFDNKLNNGVFINTIYKKVYSNNLDSETETRVCNLIQRQAVVSTSEMDIDDYLSRFAEMHNCICQHYVDKVILSRTKNVTTLRPIQLVKLFSELSDKYPHAFVYLIYTPITGVWLGAGPELLLKKNEHSFNTVSLAGTIPDDEQSKWANKEIVEQGLVSKYVEGVLKDNDAEDVKVEGPNTISAGQVKHLCTQFSFKLNKSMSDCIKLLYDLHPTPAVCGMPKDKAFEIIKRVEGYNREYYSGFLGPINDNEFEFYVNIRCLKAMSEHSTLYLGGGLTKGSVGEKEWKETELKAQTLLSVIEKI